MDTDYLREAFQDDARLAGPPPTDPYESVLARRQKSDRRRMSTLSAGLAAVLVAVAIPVGLAMVTSQDGQVASPAPISEVNVLAVPTRGSLAADTEFLDALTELSWVQPGEVSTDPAAGALPNPPVESRRVAFAGDVPGGRWALVVGPNTAQPEGEAADPDLQTDLGSLSDIAGAWFVGLPGATPDQMVLATTPRGFSTDRPSSLYNGITGALVVLAAPGDFIEVSARPEVAADGSVTRSFADGGAVDGLAVATVSPDSLAASGGMPAVQFRVIREGEVLAEQSPDSYLDPFDDGVSPEIAIEYLWPSQGPSVSRMEQWLAAGVLSEYGLSRDQVTFRAHYVGAAGHAGVQGQVYALTATFPSGAVLTRVFWTEAVMGPENSAEASGGAGGACTDSLAAAVPAELQVIAVMCMRPATSEQSPDPAAMLVVLVPPALGASSIVVEGSAGSTPIALTEQGAAVVAFPDGAQTVRVLTADGTVVVEVPILND